MYTLAPVRSVVGCSAALLHLIGVVHYILQYILSANCDCCFPSIVVENNRTTLFKAPLTEAGCTYGVALKL